MADLSAEHFKKNLILTAQEVSDLLKIPLSTLYGLSKSGRIHGVKIGKHWRYLAQDVYAYFFPNGENGSAANFSWIFERRQKPRINCELPALIQKGTAPSARAQYGFVMNLSESGLLFAHETGPSPAACDDPVRVNLELPGLDQRLEPICLEGRIVRISNGTGCRLGIKIRHLAESERRRIEAYVG